MIVVTTKEDLLNSLTVTEHAIVDFWAEWCGPCKTLAPALEEFDSTRDDVTIIKINVDKAPALAAEYGIRGIPTLMAYKDGLHVNTSVGIPGANIQESLAAMLETSDSNPE